MASLPGEMRAMNIVPDAIVFSAAISICEKRGQWQRALKFLSQMHASGVAPNERCFSATIAACEKAGQWKVAQSLTVEMHRAEREREVEMRRAERKRGVKMRRAERKRVELSDLGAKSSLYHERARRSQQAIDGARVRDKNG